MKIKGLLITTALLKKLGAILSEGVWYLRIHGYQFRFVPHSSYWRFFSGDSKDWHAVTHLDECLAFAAKDAYELGRLAPR